MKVQVTRENSTVPGYQLALVMNERQKYAPYNWTKALKVAAKETSENALRLRLYLYGWGLDGKRDSRFEADFEPHDVKGAIARAKEMVSREGALAVQVEGEASRLFAMRGFGDRAVFRIAEARRCEEGTT